MIERRLLSIATPSRNKEEKAEVLFSILNEAFLWIKVNDKHSLTNDSPPHLPSKYRRHFYQHILWATHSFELIRHLDERRFISRLKEEDNPVLMILKLKNF